MKNAYKYIFLIFYLYHLYNLQSAEEQIIQATHRSQPELTGRLVACASKHKLTRVAVKQSLSPSPHYPRCHRPYVCDGDTTVMCYIKRGSVTARHTGHVTGVTGPHALSLCHALNIAALSAQLTATPPHMLEDRKGVLFWKPSFTATSCPAAAERQYTYTVLITKQNFT